MDHQLRFDLNPVDLGQIILKLDSFEEITLNSNSNDDDLEKNKKCLKICTNQDDTIWTIEENNEKISV